MSIIEKAIDRLASDDGAQQRGQAPTSVPEQEARVTSPEAQGNRSADFSVTRELPLTREGVMAPSAPPGEACAAGLTTLDTAPLSEDAQLPAEAAAHQPVVAIHGLGLEGIISPQSETSRTAEEFRMIKRPLLQRAFSEEGPAGGHPNVIVVTSSVAGEGKTFTALNLAISIAMELDRTVLLVDADLAHPGLSRLLKMQEFLGLTERLLDDKADVKDFLLRTDVPKLTLLPAGRRHGRSTELLASNAMKGLLDELATRYQDRVVLFDSPPLLATSEASVLAEQAGQICLVVESAKTPQFLVKEALSLVSHQDRVSLVLNKTRDELLYGRRGYYYGYRYGYASGHGRGYGRNDVSA